MNSFSDRCYELLGVRPGVSVQELKAAYRDLAKVWHPDRFAHDPRLQQKAQEKLKEINDAYEQLISEKTPRPRVASRTATQGGPATQNTHSPTAKGKSKLLIWFVVPVVIFAAVFLFTIRLVEIQRNRQAQLVTEEYQSTEISDPEVATEKPISTNNHQKATASQDSKLDIQPIPTTTVIIDSTTGFLAQDGCPSTIEMTYRTGEEPRAHCTVHKPLPQRESRLKQLSRKTTAEETDDSSEKNHPEH